MDQVFIRLHTESAVHQACRFPPRARRSHASGGVARKKCGQFGLLVRTESYAT
jgi:hypothetical protein